MRRLIQSMILLSVSVAIATGSAVVSEKICSITLKSCCCELTVENCCSDSDADGGSKNDSSGCCIVVAQASELFSAPDEVQIPGIALVSISPNPFSGISLRPTGELVIPVSGGPDPPPVAGRALLFSMERFLI